MCSLVSLFVCLFVFLTKFRSFFYFFEKSKQNKQKEITSLRREKKGDYSSRKITEYWTKNIAANDSQSILLVHLLHLQ